MSANAGIACERCHHIVRAYEAANFLDAFGALHKDLQVKCPRCNGQLLLLVDTSLTTQAKELQSEIDKHSAAQINRLPTPERSEIEKSIAALAMQRSKYPVPDFDRRDVDRVLRILQFDDRLARTVASRGPVLEEEAETIAKSLVGAAADHQQALLSSIPIGVIDYPIVNALVRRVPDSSVPILLIDYMLLQYIYDFCRIVLSSMDIGLVESHFSTPMSLPRVIAPDRAVVLLRSLTHSYLKRRHFQHDYIMSRERLFLVGEMTGCAKAFVIAHEFGHIAHQHQARTHGKDHEAEADDWAITTIRSARVTKPGGRDAPENSAWTMGPLLVLALQRMIEESCGKLRRNPLTMFGALYSFPVDRNTHPSAASRWHAMKARFALTKDNYGLRAADYAWNLVDQSLA
jgi:hypothetical protein